MLMPFAAAAACQTPAEIAATLLYALAVAVAGADDAQSKTSQHRDKYVPSVLLYEIDCGRGSLIDFVHHHADFVKRSRIRSTHREAAMPVEFVDTLM